MIYFDNSAGSYPKPDNLINSAKYVLSKYSFNVGRGGYNASVKTAEKIFNVRESLGKMFGFKTENIAFTKNCTEALNYAIKGIASQDDHFIISPFEHNSVLRVLYKMHLEGKINFDIAEYSKNQNEFLNNFKKLINPKTKAIICTHSNNVFGIKLPVKQIGKICRENNIKFILDAAQGAGICKINKNTENIDILCSSGHKSLYGPSGTGFIAAGNNIKLNTIVEGGTGSLSLDLNQPEFLPDRFESGTLNTAGIILLGKGIDFINKTGIKSIYGHELKLAQILYDLMSENKNIKLYTDYPIENKFVPIISFNYKNYSSEKTAALLADCDVCVRGGYQCSPLSHKTFGTIDRGTVRISPGFFNTEKDCLKFYKILKNL